MDRRGPLKQGAVRLVGRFVDVHAGDRLGAHVVPALIDIDPRRYRNRIQCCSIVRGWVIRREEAAERIKGCKGGVFVPQAAIHDQFSPAPQIARDTASHRDVVPLALVERIVGSSRVGQILVGRTRYIARAGQILAQIVSRDVEKHAAFIGFVAQIANRLTLLCFVVLAIPIAVKSIAENGGRKWAVRCAGRNLVFPGVERAEGAFDPGVWLRTDAVLGDDVDHAADGAVAVKHRAAIAAGDFNVVDAIARNQTEIKPGQIGIVKTPPVYQHQDVRRRRDAEPAHVDSRAGAVDAAVKAGGLDAGFAAENVL